MSVVVRTKDRPRLLAEALASLAAGTWRRTEVVLVNDGGAPPELPADLPAAGGARRPAGEPRPRGGGQRRGGGGRRRLDRLPRRRRPRRPRAPRDAGAARHRGRRPRRLHRRRGGGLREPAATRPAGPASSAACRTAATSIPTCCGSTTTSRSTPCSWRAISSPRAALPDGAPFDPELPFFEDWDFLVRLAAVAPFHHLARVTCEYRHFRGGGHHVFGEAPRRARRLPGDEGAGDPPQRRAPGGRPAAAATPSTTASPPPSTRCAPSWWRRARRRSSARRDAAGAPSAPRGRRGAAARRRAGARQGAPGGALPPRPRRGGGAREERLRLAADLQRLYDEEARLRAALGERDEHLGRTYAEIERLGERIRAMEGTRAWRLHRRLESLRGR